MSSQKFETIYLLLHRIVRNKDSLIYNEDVSLTFLKELLDLIFKLSKKKKKLKKKIVLTFDDGNLSDYQIVLKELEKRNLYAYFFIIPDLIGKKNYLNWDMVKELKKSQMFIGSHSLTHKSLIHINEKSAKYEMEKSKSIIENQINKKIESFSFPYGNFNRKLIKIAKDVGYKEIFTSRHGLSSIDDIFFKRNSINQYTKSKDIKNTFDANVTKRLTWILEDSLKYPIKLYFGEKFYLNFKSFFLNR